LNNQQQPPVDNLDAGAQPAQPAVLHPVHPVPALHVNDNNNLFFAHQNQDDAQLMMDVENEDEVINVYK
jgi:hypothetical protein